MDSKSLRALAFPTVTDELKKFCQKLGKQEKNSQIVVTVNNPENDWKVYNFFLVTSTPVLIFRWATNGKECFLYNVTANRVNKDRYVLSQLRNLYGWNANITAMPETEKQEYADLGFSDTPASSMSRIIYLRENDVSAYRSEQRKNRKENSYKEDMAPVEKRRVPKSFAQTIRKTVESIRYIFYNRKEGTVKCSCCGGVSIIKNMPKFKDKDIVKCPACGKTGEARSYTRQSSSRNVFSNALIQAYGRKQLVIRWFETRVTYNEGIAVSDTSEVMRDLLDFSNRKVKEYEWYWFNKKNQWTPPQPSLFNTSGQHYSIYKGFLHKAGITEELRKTGLDKTLAEWKQIISRDLVSRSAEGVFADVNYFYKVCLYPVIEKLVKCGFNNIAEPYIMGSWFSGKENLLDENANSLIKAMKINRYLFAQLPKNISTDDLQVLQSYVKNSPDTSRTVKEILDIAKVVSIHDCDKIFEMNKASGDKTIRYIKKQVNANKEVHASDYFDYLRMAKKLEYNLSDEMVRYPKDLKECHDELTKLIKYKELEAEYAIIDKIIPDMSKKWNYEEDELLIRYPVCGREITDEGVCMGHCVNSYVGAVAERNTDILFVRKKSAPKTPFVTVEIKDGKVRQVRAKRNADPGQKVKDFMERYKKVKALA